MKKDIDEIDAELTKTMEAMELKVMSQRFYNIPSSEIILMFRDRFFNREKWLINDLGSAEEQSKIFTMLENAGYFFEEGIYGEENDGQDRLRQPEPVEWLKLTYNAKAEKKDPAMAWRGLRIQQEKWNRAKHLLFEHILVKVEPSIKAELLFLFKEITRKRHKEGKNPGLSGQ